MRLLTLLVAGLAGLAQAQDQASSPVLDLVARKDGGSGNSGSGNSGSGSSGSGSGNSGSGSGNSGSGGGGGGGGKCPAIWNTISADLKAFYTAGSGSECNDYARAAIRMIFHDCGAWDTTQGLTGGCDGSLANTDEVNRPENGGLQEITQICKAKAAQYGVTVADMLVFMGNKAILVCPGGPRVKTFIGRTDSFTPAPEGGLPDVHAPAAELATLFAKKGYSGEDLAALLGAHSTSKQFGVNTTVAGAPQDTTPGQWDVAYYKQTYNFAKGAPAPAGVFVFPSDQKLATYQDVGKAFQGFIDNQGKWTSKFADAMARMALFGNNKDRMADCTNAL